MDMPLFVSESNLLRSFREMGLTADAAAPALQARLYPLGGPLGTLTILYARPRIIAQIGGRLEVWISLTGASPTRRTAHYDFEDLSIESDDERAHTKVRLGGRRLWVHERNIGAVYERRQLRDLRQLGG
jgi:hypothetical protein